MGYLNKVFLIGACGRDPEVRYLPSGQAVANVSLATTNKYKDRSGNLVEDTQWHRLNFFDKTAEIAAEYVKKGSSIHVEGRIKYGKYTDKEGIERTSVDIMVDRLTLLGGRQDGDGPRQQQSQPSQRPAQPQRTPGQQARHNSQQEPSDFDDVPPLDDDIPFLFNMNTVSDTMGLSKSKHRIKHGPKALHILWAQAPDF